MERNRTARFNDDLASLQLVTIFDRHPGRKHDTTGAD
jgi:hypothetical protein